RHAADGALAGRLARVALDRLEEDLLAAFLRLAPGVVDDLAGESRDVEPGLLLDALEDFLARLLARPVRDAEEGLVLLLEDGLDLGLAALDLRGAPLKGGGGLRERLFLRGESFQLAVEVVLAHLEPLLDLAQLGPLRVRFL